ncbi:MAG TPA: hypothetical protein VJL07_03090 [Dehalococcoidia bacterium]|nr:hypothetical protein [Dehalococcoidia bacterium]
MPPMTTVQTFIEALRTGQTRTTLAFDRIFTPPYDQRVWLADIRVPGVFHDALPPWAVAALREEGLTGEEIAHINQWPNELKEQIRQVVVRAIDARPPRRVHFRWGFTTAPEPRLEPPPTTDRDPHVVEFRTPRSALRQAGPDDIDVGIYPPAS